MALFRFTNAGSFNGKLNFHHPPPPPHMMPRHADYDDMRRPMLPLPRCRLMPAPLPRDDDY